MTAGTSMAPRTAHPIEQFARTHHRTLERWLQRRFGTKLSDEDISDVLAETYRAALETIETRDFEAERMSAWAYQVARFRAIAVLRSREGRAGAAERPQVTPLRFGVELSDTPVDPEGDAMREEEALRVTDALRRLPDDQRE